jgi:hypothetical protein
MTHEPACGATPRINPSTTTAILPMDFEGSSQALQNTQAVGIDFEFRPAQSLNSIVVELSENKIRTQRSLSAQSRQCRGIRPSEEQPASPLDIGGSKFAEHICDTQLVKNLCSHRRMRGGHWFLYSQERCGIYSIFLGGPHHIAETGPQFFHRV